MIGDITSFPFNWVPVGWKVCDGRILPIKGNEKLFAILQTKYGGDGQTNFALPTIPFQATQSGTGHTSDSSQQFRVSAQIVYVDAGKHGVSLFAGNFVPGGFKACDGSAGRPNIPDMKLNYIDKLADLGSHWSYTAGEIYFYIKIK